MKQKTSHNNKGTLIFLNDFMNVFMNESLNYSPLN